MLRETASQINREPGATRAAGRLFRTTSTDSAPQFKRPTTTANAVNGFGKCYTDFKLPLTDLLQNRLLEGLAQGMSLGTSRSVKRQRNLDVGPASRPKAILTSGGFLSAGYDMRNGSWSPMMEVEGQKGGGPLQGGESDYRRGQDNAGGGI